MTETAALQEFIHRHERIFLLTGAGVSTRSGLPDYRDDDGAWKRPQPVTYQAFMKAEATRQRYWARSLVGWGQMGEIRPNGAHRALARLEARGGAEVLVTQNVDRLHQAAGSTQVIDLHGRLDLVRCMHCERRMPRAAFQSDLATRNPGWAELVAARAPDGDAELEDVDFSRFAVPPCPVCGGIQKPDVVFYGESVPRHRVETAFAHLAAADAMLVIGSSLMVRSGFRFVEAAAAAGKPIAAVNLGKTRGDALFSLKVEAESEAALKFLVE
ncbi:NAD-dependent deacetylase [Pseudoroseomonas deserti]|uniref:NAD-dependent protein deacetylase n=1 Tax=Teichococcus deserti TaxID=1817963 RepID=A0A1V2GYZ6_9PROT|nr:NAD-dependent protein deacetylase [Pseudoroseomonas deserti]ONG50141.1 NAD-dependent deacetylase [Pseudoroseomonas deserti]